MFLGDGVHLNYAGYILWTEYVRAAMGRTDCVKWLESECVLTADEAYEAQQLLGNSSEST